MCNIATFKSSATTPERQGPSVGEQLSRRYLGWPFKSQSALRSRSASPPAVYVRFSSKTSGSARIDGTEDGSSRRVALIVEIRTVSTISTFTFAKSCRRINHRAVFGTANKSPTHQWQRPLSRWRTRLRSRIPNRNCPRPRFRQTHRTGNP